MTKRKKTDKKKVKRKKEKKVPLIWEFVGGFLPGLSSFSKKLEETSPKFRKEIQKVEKEMRLKIRTGWSKQDPKVKYSFSMRPLFPERIEVPREKEKLKILLEVPEDIRKEELKVYTVGRRLIIMIRDRKYIEEIKLPFYAKREIDWEYENGILLVKLNER